MDDPPDSISVMTFNMRYASAKDGDNAWRNPGQTPNRRDAAKAMLARHRPDIIGMQEGEDAQLDELFADLPHYRIERQKPSGGGGNENAAIAWNPDKFELLNRGVFSLGPSPGPDYAHSAGEPFDPNSFFPDLKFPFPRIALRILFRCRATGRQFYFYSTHFDLNENPQALSAALIIKDAQSRPTPLAIVCGDFNSPPNAAAWRLFTGEIEMEGARGDFTDSWLQANEPTRHDGTMHDFQGGKIPSSWRIDWILHRGGFRTRSARIIYDFEPATRISTPETRPQHPSDHYPVIAHLRFPESESDV